MTDDEIQIHSIDALNISTKTKNVLKSLGINTIGHLLNDGLSHQKLWMMRNKLKDKILEEVDYFIFNNRHVK